MSKLLSDLHPYVKYLCEQFMEKCKASGLHPTITSTYRTLEEQADIYAQGRTKTGEIVSYTPAGYSIHNYKLAFDCSFPNDAEYTKASKIGKALGLTWGGDFKVKVKGQWKAFRDRPHYQWTGGLTIDELRAGKIPESLYEVIGTTFIIRISPNKLKASAIKGKSGDIAKKYKNFVNGNFFGKAIIGWLISDGKVLSERHEEGHAWEKPKGSLIVYKNGDVVCGLKKDSEIVQMKGLISFCCQGFNLFPVDLAREGFLDVSIARSCNRVAIGYNKTSQKIILAVRAFSDATRARQTLLNLGCDSGICLDSGSSCNLFVDGQALFKTDSTLTNILTW